MKKIPTVFRQDRENKPVLVVDEVHPKCQWVLDGQGIAIVKYDGTSCMVKDGVLYKRYEHHVDSPIPWGFIAAQDPDPNTGKQPGWLEVGNGPEDKWHREALGIHLMVSGALKDGTYELIGPKVNGNKQMAEEHIFISHGCMEAEGVERTFEGMKEWLETHDYEGIVFHHADGRMAKIRRKDFGFKW